MYKITSLIFLMSAAVCVWADTLKVESGVGLWSQEVEGPIKYLNTPEFYTDDLGYGKQMKPYLWLDLKHPLPVVPNLRLEYADIKFTGTADKGFIFENKPFPINTDSTTSLEQIDMILYYNILDKRAFTTLDLGLDIKYMDASFDAYSKGLFLTLQTYEQIELFLPLVYSRLRFDLPLDIGIEAEGKYIEFKNNRMQDYSIKVDYTLVDVLPVNIGLELGYRFENVKLDQSDFDEINFDADLDVKGVFAGAVVRF